MLSCHWTQSDSISKSPTIKAKAWYCTHTPRSQPMPFFTPQLTPPFLTSLYSYKRLWCDWQDLFDLILLQKLTKHVSLYQTPLLAATKVIRGSLGALSELCFGGGVTASKGEGKGHVVKSPLSSSFICSSVFVTTICEGSRFPMCP